MLNNHKFNLRYIDYKEKQHQGWISQDMKVGGVWFGFGFFFENKGIIERTLLTLLT